MHKILRSFYLLIFTVLCGVYGSGQSFTGIYTFSGVTTLTGPVDPTPVPVATGITFGQFHVVGNPSSNPNANGRFSFPGWPTPITSGINLGEYFEVVIRSQPNYAFTLNTLNFTVQRSATGISQFSVRSSADGYNANLNGSYAGADLSVDANNVFKVTTTGTAGTYANCKITFSNVTNFTAPDTLRFYGWAASSTGGTFSLNRVEFAGAATVAAGTPSLTLDTNNIRFPTTYLNSSSPALHYSVKGTDLSDPLVVIASGPFTVSDAENGLYGSSLTLDVSGILTPKNIFVKFTPVTTGTFTGTISNSSTNAASLSVSVTGQAADPSNLSFNFNSCSAAGMPGAGFISYSVTGAQAFACSQFGNNGTTGVDINGYSGGAVENEDWLISPPVSIGSLSAPILSFYSRGEFTGPTLQLLISVDYDGYGNPNTATWTDLQASFPPLTNTWTLTDGINLSAYKSAPKFYVAFKYSSSPDLGAARWTLDDVNINDRTKLLSASPVALNFAEVSSGSSSTGQPVAIRGFGYGNFTVTAPAGYQVSADNSSFTSSVQVIAENALNGSTVYVRFSPSTKSLKLEGNIRISASGLDTGIVSLTGSSYPKAETFDVGAYNLSFFGSNPTNNPTPQKITTQINNIATVFQHLNLDIVGVEEVSSDSAIGVLISKLPGYAASLSNRWSYSFDPPDPAFPPQKIGFIYNTSTAQLTEQRVMFEGLYDSIRRGQATLPGYPEDPTHFWGSGRLPFMATFNVTISGITKRIRVIDIHAKASSDVASYNRRVYDVKLLKDSLDRYYKDDNVILVGDYNDRVYGSIYAGGVSPYRIYVTDTANYSALDYPLDSAGRVSFISGTGLIDHIIISNELKRNYISNSTDIEDARTYISGYNATTASDHLPIFTRLTLTTEAALPVKLTRFTAETAGKTILLTWRTEQENNNDHFVVERSGDGRNYYALATIAGTGTSNLVHTYQHVDSLPLAVVNYYRLRQVDLDGKATLSNTVAVRKQEAVTVSVYPNPVTGFIQINGASSSVSDYTARITTTDGKLVMHATGTVKLINQVMNQHIGKLKAGMYILNLTSSDAQHSLKFMKQ